jgi:hypothetical protein
VRPRLKCKSPCYNCFDSDATFCTSCWGLGENLERTEENGKYVYKSRKEKAGPNKGRNLPLNSKLYLQPAPVAGNLGGTRTVAPVTTCADKCASGWSINGEAVGVKMKQIEGSRRTSRGAEYKLTDPPAADDLVNA